MPQRGRELLEDDLDSIDHSGHCPNAIAVSESCLRTWAMPYREATSSAWPVNGCGGSGR